MGRAAPGSGLLVLGFRRLLGRFLVRCIGPAGILRADEESHREQARECLRE